MDFQFLEPVVRNGVLLALIFLGVAFYVIRRNARSVPPGPWGLPYLGMVPYFFVLERVFGLQGHEIMQRLATRHGRVFSFIAFGRLVVVLNDASIVKEAYQHTELNDRPKMRIKNYTLGKGVALANGECWKEQRNFTIRTLESLGVGTPSREKKISDEVGLLLDELTAAKGKSFDPKHHLMICVSNIISNLMFSTRQSYDDAEFKDFLDMVAEITHLMGTAGAINSNPLLKHFPFASKNVLGKMTSTELKHMKRLVREHRERLAHGKNLQDFTAAYLREIVAKERQGEPGSNINDTNLPYTLMHVFSAGTENVSTMLRWGLLYMLAVPGVQERVQSELDAVVGRGRLPRYSDETALPYTRATLQEIQRLASVAPLGVAHMSTQEFTLNGYTIPARTTVVPNIWFIHYNPKVWKDPAKFNPERFLGPEAKVGGDGLMSFSAGNRICVGRHLAKIETFLIFTHLLHRFSLQKSDDSPPLSFHGHGSFARVPDSYRLRAMPRN